MLLLVAARLSNRHITDNARTRDTSFHHTAVRSTRPYLETTRTANHPLRKTCPARDRARKPPAPQAVHSTRPHLQTRPYAQPTRSVSRAQHAPAPANAPVRATHPLRRPCTAHPRTCKRACTHNPPTPQAMHSMPPHPQTRPYAQPTRSAGRAQHAPASAHNLASASSTTRPGQELFFLRGF